MNDNTNNVVYGNLGQKYFEPDELKLLGKSVDLTHVPYLETIDLDKLGKGCPVVDCIPSIDVPRFAPVSGVNWVPDETLVIGLSLNGVERAYPTNVLVFHEIVNDLIDDVPVVVSYCPLCYSATAFIAPTLEGEVARFGVSGRLYQSDLVLYDRVTLSFWSQVERTVIAGPLAGRTPALAFLPVEILPWAVWKAQYPKGQVLACPTASDPLGGKPAKQAGTEWANDYLQKNERLDAYAADHKRLAFPVTLGDRRLDNKRVVVGVEVNGGAKAYPKDAIEQAGLINDQINGVPIVLACHPHSGAIVAFERPAQKALSLEGTQLTDGQNRWDLKGNALSDCTPLKPALYLQVYWFSWQSFHPQAALYGESI